MLKRQVAIHIIIGIFVNLITVGFLILGEHITSPYNYLAWLGAILILGILSGALQLASMHQWKAIKSMGYYFLPTTFLCLYLHERRARRDLQITLDRIQEAYPPVKLSVDLAYPQNRASALKEVLDDLPNQADRQLAPILIQIRTYASDICSEPNGPTYTLFKQILDTIASLSPQNFQMTWDIFLGLLGDIFDPDVLGSIGDRVRKDCVSCLKEAMRKVNGRHLNGITRIVEAIMRRVSADHDVARTILEMILDGSCSREIHHNILHNAVKRDLKYPPDFGFDVLNVLKRLEYKVFWLNIDILREIINAWENFAGKGIISLNAGLYQELCRGVFSPLEDHGHSGVHYGSVFRRLQGTPGNIAVACVFPDGKTCSCQGKSLSFRGFYTESHTKPEGEDVNCLTISSVVDPNRKFKFRATVAPLHRNQDGTPATRGRGVFFEDAEESEVQRLYEYIHSP
jgi:hypothetical protein